MQTRWDESRLAYPMVLPEVIVTHLVFPDPFIFQGAKALWKVNHLERHREDNPMSNWKDRKYQVPKEQ